jgi:urease beta subunit
MNTLQASDFNFTKNVQTGTAYTLVATDRGKLLEFSNSGSISLTIPTSAAVTFEIGDRVDVLLASTGTITIGGAPGVSVAAEGGITTISSQWTRVTLIKRTTDDWVITGGSGEVQTAEIEDGAITESKLATGSVTSDKIFDGTIVNADINAAAAIALSKLATGALPTAITVASANMVDGTIVNADINAAAAIEASKISGTAITAADSGTVTSTMIADGTIVNADINASAAIDKTKISGTAVTLADTGVITSTMIENDSIVNADIKSNAAIAYSKLSLSNSIVNADISSSAAIEQGKIADSTIDTKTSNYTLVLTDKNKFIEMNVGSANTVSVPTDASVNFPIGSQINITQYGSGKTQVVAVTSGTTSIRSTPGQFLRAQYSSATLVKRAANEWYLIGDLSAS